MSSSPTSSKLDVATLRKAVGGDVFAPGDEGYDAARQAWNLTVDQRPAAVVLAADIGDVAPVVRFAAGAGLRVAPQATGHGAVALPPLEDAILLRLSRAADVVVDPGRRTARVGPGALWGEVSTAAGEHGLAGLGGSSPTVGVVGYHLGGGLGWLGRPYGLAAERVRNARVVTGTGEIVSADEDREPELLWALRGGYGAGIVTALEFELVPLATAYAGSLTFDAEHAATVLAGYLGWAAEAPREMTSLVRLLNLPPLEVIPEPLRGRSLIDITLAYAGDAAAGEALVAPLRALAPPIVDRIAEIPAAELCRIAGDPEQPTPGMGGHAMLRELTPDVVDAFLAVAGPGSGSPLTATSLRHLGGALGEAPDGAGALGRLDGSWALHMVGVPAAPGSAEQIGAHMARVLEAVAPVRAERDFLNFRDDPAPASTGLAAPVVERLRAVRAAVDPHGLVIAKHPLD